MLKKIKKNIDSHSKSQKKRIVTTHSSQVSIFQSGLKSLGIKKFSNKVSQLNNPPKKKEKNKQEKSKRKIINLKNQRESHQLYERIPMMKSNTNSEIQFSNYGESHKEPKRQISKKNLYIDCSDEYIVKSIWNRNPRHIKITRVENEAAIKIQKVFRGYMTRNLLMKYIEKEQKKLLEKMEYFKEQNNNNRSQMHYKSTDQPTGMMTSVDEFAYSNDKPHHFISYNEEQQYSLSPGGLDINSQPNSFFPSPNKINKRRETLQSVQESQQKAEQSLIENPLDMESEIIANQNQTNFSLMENNLIVEEKSFTNLNQYSLTFNESESKEVPDSSISFNVDQKHSSKFIHSKHHSNYSSLHEEIKESYQDSQQDSQQGSDSHPFHTQLPPETNQHFSHINQQMNQKDLSRKTSKEQLLVEHEIEQKQRKQIDEEFSSEEFQISVYKLKEAEKQKWEHIITMLSQQLNNQRKSQEKIKSLMNQILQISVKNRQQLCNCPEQRVDGATITPTTNTHRFQQFNIPQKKHQENISFRKKTYPLNSYQQYQTQILRITDFDQNAAKIKKNQNMPMLYRAKEKQQKSILERTQNLKKFFLKNLKTEDQHIEKMMEFRQIALKKKESETLLKIHEMLERDELTHQQFIKSLDLLKIKFEKEKKEIDRTKVQIYQGYKAQMQLVKMTAVDAKFLGYKISFCRSMEFFPGNNKWRFDSVMIDEMDRYQKNRQNNQENLINTQKIQQIQNFTKEQEEIATFEKRQELVERQKIENGEAIDKNSDDSINFDYEETGTYKKCQPFSFDISSYSECSNLDDSNLSNSKRQFQRISEISQLSHKIKSIHPEHVLTPRKSYVVINNDSNSKNRKGEGCSEEEDGGWREEEDGGCREGEVEIRNCSSREDDDLPIAQMREVKKETYELQYDEQESSEEEILYKEDNQPWMDDIITSTTCKLIWETVEELFTQKALSFHLYHPPTNLSSLTKITNSENQSFLDLVQTSIPTFQLLSHKINQKMYANVKELLISMRDQPDDTFKNIKNQSNQLEQQQNDVEYYEVGQYQYLLSQEICFSAIHKYLQRYNLIKMRKNKLYELEEKKKSEEMIKEAEQFCSPHLFKIIGQKEQFNEMRKQQNQELRVQILKIEMHVILDSWNEEIIRFRENRSGYSGIGLNEITLALIDKVSPPITEEVDFQQMILFTKNKVKAHFNEKESSQEKLVKEDHQYIICSDGQWINYVHQSLEYAYDLVKIIQLDLIIQAMSEIQIISSSSPNFESQRFQQIEAFQDPQQFEQPSQFESQQQKEKSLKLETKMVEKQMNEEISGEEEEDSFEKYTKSQKKKDDSQFFGDESEEDSFSD